MALKDWKDISMGGKGWAFKKKLKVLQITAYGMDLSKLDYAIRVYNDAGWTSETIEVNKHFKTKSQALKFAKEYMRTH